MRWYMEIVDATELWFFASPWGRVLYWSIDMTSLISTSPKQSKSCIMERFEARITVKFPSFPGRFWSLSDLFLQDPTPYAIKDSSLFFHHHDHWSSFSPPAHQPTTHQPPPTTINQKIPSPIPCPEWESVPCNSSGMGSSSGMASISATKASASFSSAAAFLGLVEILVWEIYEKYIMCCFMEIDAIFGFNAQKIKAYWTRTVGFCHSLCTVLESIS